MTSPRLVVLLALSAGMLAAAQGSDIHLDVRAVLTRYLSFSTTELADLQRNKVARHGIDTRAPSEVAVVGAVKVNAPKAAFFARVRDIARFKSSPDVLQIGRFSNPPTLADLAPLTVDKDDFDVRTCRVGDCGIRLPADLIRRLQQDIDATAPDAQERAAAWFKQILLDDITAYVSGQAGRFSQYDDGERPIRPLDEFAGLLENMPAIGALVPSLPDHLKAFPASRVPDAEDFLYWSKEKFGFAPFITVTHVTIVCQSPSTCVMTTKDVYSSRYIDASLALAIASDAAGTPDAFYLVYANRSRATALKGGMSWLRRTVVERRARGSLEESLRTIKIHLEKGL
jgi:hypothetical protein